MKMEPLLTEEIAIQRGVKEGITINGILINNIRLAENMEDLQTLTS